MVERLKCLIGVHSELKVLSCPVEGSRYWCPRCGHAWSVNNKQRKV